MISVSLLLTHSVMTNTLVEGNDTGVFKKLGSRVEIDDCVIRNHTDGVVGWTSSDTLLVKNSTIDSSSTSGVLCYASTVTILRNTIVKDNPVGVRGYYNSIPEIRGRSMIKDNAQEGLKCEIGSHAVVESTTIKGNFIGVLADTSSTPQLGRTSGGPSVGRNVIADNDTFEVDNNHLTATIKAEKNYWGASGPDTTKIDGRVDYTPWLHSKPDIEPEIEAVAGYVPNDLEFPGRYHLTYNYPNPFNPTTRLKYDVPAPGGIVQMVIYNIRGQRVTTLLNRSRPAGTYTVTWNGKDDRGQPVASGVYFVRMSAGSFKQIRKIVLLK